MLAKRCETKKEIRKCVDKEKENMKKRASKQEKRHNIRLHMTTVNKHNDQDREGERGIEGRSKGKGKNKDHLTDTSCGSGHFEKSKIR